jgi:hypothetical protein
MSVTISERLNGDQLQAHLPAGIAFSAFGGALDSTDEKTIVAEGIDDAALQAAIDAAVAAYVDFVANLTALLQKARNALANNAAFLAIPSPTNAQAVAQVQALSKQMDAVVRVVAGLFDSTSGT